MPGRRSIPAAPYEHIADADLLERFVRGKDETAFAALLERHGPMVLGVCRRVLGNAHEAEDAFQATFLVLARKAPSLVRQELVGNWLWGVAYRTARRARADAGRWHDRKREVRIVTAPDPVEEKKGLERFTRAFPRPSSNTLCGVLGRTLPSPSLGRLGKCLRSRG